MSDHPSIDFFAVNFTSFNNQKCVEQILEYPLFFVNVPLSFICWTTTSAGRLSPPSPDLYSNPCQLKQIPDFFNDII